MIFISSLIHNRRQAFAFENLKWHHGMSIENKNTNKFSFYQNSSTILNDDISI